MCGYLRIYINGKKVRSVGGMSALNLIKEISEWQRGTDSMRQLFNTNQYESLRETIIEIHEVKRIRSCMEKRRNVRGWIFEVVAGHITEHYGSVVSSGNHFDVVYFHNSYGQMRMSMRMHQALMETVHHKIPNYVLDDYRLLKSPSI